MKQNIVSIEGIVDLEFDLVDIEAPIQEKYEWVLKALQYIHRRSKNVDGFWIRAGQIKLWLDANDMVLSEVSIGKILQGMGFLIKKRIPQGMFRWISTKQLFSLIDKYDIV